MNCSTLDLTHINARNFFCVFDYIVIEFMFLILFFNWDELFVLTKFSHFKSKSIGCLRDTRYLFQCFFFVYTWLFPILSVSTIDLINSWCHWIFSCLPRICLFQFCKFYSFRLFRFHWSSMFFLGQCVLFQSERIFWWCYQHWLSSSAFTSADVITRWIQLALMSSAKNTHWFQFRRICSIHST